MIFFYCYESSSNGWILVAILSCRTKQNSFKLSLLYQIVDFQSFEMYAIASLLYSSEFLQQCIKILVPILFWAIVWKQKLIRKLHAFLITITFTILDIWAEFLIRKTAWNIGIWNLFRYNIVTDFERQHQKPHK